MGKHVRSSAIVAGAAAAAVVLGAAPASADAVGGTSGGGGFQLQAVSVVVSGGQGDPVSGGSISVSVPPKCWWTPFNMANLGYYPDIDPDDPDWMQQYLGPDGAGTYGSSFAPSTLSYPSQQYFENHQGADWTWYTLASAPGVNCADEGFTQSGGQGPEGWGTIPISYAAFPAGQAPPPPLVDVDDVVEAVWDQAAAEVTGPQLAHNPSIDGLGGATLVNLATWFWVQNVQESLAGDGRIDLQVSIPGTPVQATLTASTDGVQITSPAGAVVCSVPQSTTRWADGVDEAQACTFPFGRPNRAGWPVTAQTTWQGTWQGTDRNGATGGTLAALTPSATVSVPVVESQTLVTDVD